MFKNSVSAIVVSIGLATLTIGSAANAAIVETDSSSSANGAVFDWTIRATDIINTGQATLASASETNDAGNAGGIAPSHDGSTANNPWVTYEYMNNLTTFTYQLNTNPLTGGRAGGYNITNVNVVKGWDNTTPYSWQKWDLQIATVSNPTFTTVWSVNYTPPTSLATLVELSGNIGTGVTGIQIQSYDSGQGFSVLHEIDVFVPEPASLGLLSAAGLLALRRPRN